MKSAPLPAYCHVPTDALTDRRLSLKARGVFLATCSFLQEHRTLTIRQLHGLIAGTSPKQISERWLRGILAQIELAGYVRIDGNEVRLSYIPPTEER